MGAVIRRFTYAITKKTFEAWERADGALPLSQLFMIARAQEKPFILHYANGRSRNYGVVFRRDVFEWVAYCGYVRSCPPVLDVMQWPLRFETWLGKFRYRPDKELEYALNQGLRGALPLYLEGGGGR